MSVDRCVCKNVTFKRLLELSRHLGTDFAKLQAATECGTGCGMCMPYARVALKTGKARLPIMTEQQFESLLGNDMQGSGQDSTNAASQ